MLVLYFCIMHLVSVCCDCPSLQVVYKLLKAMDVTYGVNVHRICAGLHAVAEHLGSSMDTLDLLVIMEWKYWGRRL